VLLAAVTHEKQACVFVCARARVVFFFFCENQHSDCNIVLRSVNEFLPFAVHINCRSADFGVEICR